MNRLMVVSPVPSRGEALTGVVSSCTSLSLDERAARLWPDSAWHRREWARAVQVVRATKRGWLADSQVGRTA